MRVRQMALVLEEELVLDSVLELDRPLAQVTGQGWVLELQPTEKG